MAVVAQHPACAPVGPFARTSLQASPPGRICWAQYAEALSCPTSLPASPRRRTCLQHWTSQPHPPSHRYAGRGPSDARGGAGLGGWSAPGRGAAGCQLSCLCPLFLLAVVRHEHIPATFGLHAGGTLMRSFYAATGLHAGDFLPFVRVLSAGPTPRPLPHRYAGRGPSDARGVGLGRWSAPARGAPGTRSLLPCEPCAHSAQHPACTPAGSW